MEAASDAGRSGIGGASMEATDEAGDKGADDADAGEDGMVSEGTEPAPALSQGLGGEAIMGDKKEMKRKNNNRGITIVQELPPRSACTWSNLAMVWTRSCASTSREPNRMAGSCRRIGL